MSRPIDYSRFNKVLVSDDEQDGSYLQGGKDQGSSRGGGPYPFPRSEHFNPHTSQGFNSLQPRQEPGQCEEYYSCEDEEEGGLDPRKIALTPDMVMRMMGHPKMEAFMKRHPPPPLLPPGMMDDFREAMFAGSSSGEGRPGAQGAGISTSSGQTSQQAAKGGLTLERKKVTTKSKKTTSRRGPTASLTRGLEDVCIASDDSMPSLVSDDGDDDVEPSAEAPPGDSKGDVDEAAWSVAKLKKELASLGRSSRGLTEKAELVAVVRQARRAQRAKQMEGGAPPAKEAKGKEKMPFASPFSPGFFGPAGGSRAQAKQKEFQGGRGSEFDDMPELVDCSSRSSNGGRGERKQKGKGKSAGGAHTKGGVQRPGSDSDDMPPLVDVSDSSDSDDMPPLGDVSDSSDDNAGPPAGNRHQNHSGPSPFAPGFLNSRSARTSQAAARQPVESGQAAPSNRPNGIGEETGEDMRGLHASESPGFPDLPGLEDVEDSSNEDAPEAASAAQQRQHGQRHEEAEGSSSEEEEEAARERRKEKNRRKREKRKEKARLQRLERERAEALQAEQSTQAAGEGRLEDLADESEAGSDDLMEEQDLPIAVGELLAPADEEMRKIMEALQRAIDSKQFQDLQPAIDEAQRWLIPNAVSLRAGQVRNLLQQARVILQTEAQGRPQTRSMPPGMPIPMPMAKPMPSPTPWGGLGAAGAAPSATIPTPFPAGPPVPSSALPSPYPLPNPGAGLVAAPTPQTSTALPDGLAAFLRPPPSGQQPDALGLFLSQHARRQLEEDLQDECCICLDRKQDMVFQPCQHRVCRFCGEKLFLEAVRLLCPMCRQVVQKRVPLCPEDRKTPARKPRPGR